MVLRFVGYFLFFSWKTFEFDDFLQAVSCSNLTNDDVMSMRSMSVDETPGGFDGSWES